MKNESNFNILISSSMESFSVVLGTPQSLDLYSTYKGNQDNNIIKCYSAIDDEYDGGLLSQYIIEPKLKIDPFTGCCSSIDYLSNTTSFEKRGLYDDLTQYSLTLSATNIFSQTFPGNNLRGDELSVACTAFCLQEFGHTFRIIIHPNEINLRKFCEIQRWNYEVVNLMPYL